MNKSMNYEESLVNQGLKEDFLDESFNNNNNKKIVFNADANSAAHASQQP